MKLCKVNNLVENSILARPVMTEDYQILLAEGTVLKKEYIIKMKEFFIQEVYIEEDIDVEAVHILKSETNNSIKNKVKDILERHTYQKNEELIKLSKTADSIIIDILNDDKVIKKVYDIKQRNADIYEHSVNVCTLAILVAAKLDLSRKKIHDIGVGCLLHDLGIRYLSISYDNKDIEELNKFDIAEYKKHPVYGYSAIKNEIWLSDISKDIILSHHELKDGTGYPLRINKISEECQIVTICDTFDELICGIGYKRLKIYEAVEYMKSYASIYYNKDVVSVFLEFIAVYPIGSQIITSEGEFAIVIRQNNEFVDRPIIKVIKDKSGNMITEDKIINLLENHHIFIDKVLN